MKPSIRLTLQVAVFFSAIAVLSPANHFAQNPPRTGTGESDRHRADNERDLEDIIELSGKIKKDNEPRN